jgi:hypothetical protein
LGSAAISKSYASAGTKVKSMLQLGTYYAEYTKQ